MKIQRSTIVGAALLAACLLATSVVSAAEQKQYVEMLEEDFEVANFTQKLDHFEPTEVRTFNQRYFWNDTFWDTTTGPIFLFICGEGRCKPPTTRGYPYQMCQDLSCAFYVLEHRFYGDSQPLADWSTESLKYLNSTQALADINDFITAMNA